MARNYNAAFNFVKTTPAHPALIGQKDFEVWVNSLIDALKTASEEPAAKPALAPLPKANPNAVNSVTIYTDGACSGNPGKGGYGAVLMFGEHTKELSGAQEHATNNQMELMAAIAALEALRKPVDVVLRSDSAYLVKNYRYVEFWRSNNWIKRNKEPVINAELWQRLADLAAQKCLSLTLEHVRGHNGNALNERCDALAKAAISG